MCSKHLGVQTFQGFSWILTTFFYCFYLILFMASVSLSLFSQCLFLSLMYSIFLTFLLPPNSSFHLSSCCLSFLRCHNFSSPPPTLFTLLIFSTPLFFSHLLTLWLVGNSFIQPGVNSHQHNNSPSVLPRSLFSHLFPSLSHFIRCISSYLWC